MPTIARTRAARRAKRRIATPARPTKRSLAVASARAKRYLARTKREQSLEDKAVAYAKRRGFLARKMNGLGYRAWPDRLFIRRDGTFWVEFKRLGERPTTEQGQLHKQLQDRGQLVYACDTFAKFTAIIRWRQR